MTATSTTTAILSVTIGTPAIDDRNSRRRTRGVATDSGAMVRAARIVRNGQAFSAVADHGGSVCNNYGHSAVTDGVVYLTVRDGATVSVVCLADELPANKVTLSGVGNLFGFGLGDIWDGRVGEARKAEAKARARQLAADRIAAGEVLLTVVLSDEVRDIADDASLTPEAREQAVRDLCGCDLSDAIRQAYNAAC